MSIVSGQTPLFDNGLRPQLEFSGKDRWLCAPVGPGGGGMDSPDCQSFSFSPMLDANRSWPLAVPRRALECAAALATLLVPLGRLPLHGQVVTTAQVDSVEIDNSGDNPATPTQGFTVPKADSQTIDKLDDFDRYVGKQSWELAFRVIDALVETDNHQMVPAQQGFLFPIGQRIRQSLLHLPPAGRDAYRLFNDAAAKRLWDQLQNPSGAIRPDEVATLRKIVDRYFLTSVGDLAADRLGDALFEQGDFANAEALWQSIVRDYPDSRLSPAKLQLKRCLALARLDRREQLAALVAQMRDEYRDQKVTIGGREVAAGDFAQSLVATEDPTPPALETATAQFLLPKTEEPAWQIHIISQTALKQMDQLMINQGWPNAHFAGAVPEAAIDGQRIYVDWFGIIYAADLATGKMLWRTGKFADLLGNGPNNNGQNLIWLMQVGVNPARFSLSAAGGKVLAMRRDPNNPNGYNGNAMFQLECLDGASGKSLWNSSSWQLTVLAPPFIVGGVGYVLGVGQESRDTLSLAAISLASGHLDWKIDLGKPQGIQNNQGGHELPGPHVLALGDMLYIATNNGALLGVSLSQRRLQWAFQHDTRPFVQGQMMWNGMMAGLFETPGTLLDVGGTVYLKDSSARLLYALDLARPSVKWQRPIDSEDMIIGIDGQTAYLLGHELSALDLKTRQLLWSTRIPAATGSLRPVICPQHIYVSSSRGIYDVDPASGDIRQIFRGADRDTGGGRLFLAGDKLISITDTAVTAYPVQHEAAAH